MAYDRKLLEKWFETRAEVFVQKAGRGFMHQTIDAEEVKKEFRIIALEIGTMLENQQTGIVAKEA